MSSEEWDEIKQAFERALKLPGPERADYIDAVCGDRPEIRRVLTDLIANHNSQDSVYPSESSPGHTRAFADYELVGERFRIARMISRGGMGEVYEAYDETLRCAVALKTVRPDLAQDRQALDRFRREIRISHEVAHSSICRVYDLIEHRSVGSDRVIPCLTMELLPGESLAQYLAKSRPLTTQEAMPLIRQVAAALEVLHGRDIVHRDLKPSNIMMVPGRNGSMRAVLMDFGLARPVRNNPEMFETRTNLQAGAPYFMAPELLMGERPSFASDVYAFGLVIDEMVTRSRAYTAESLHFLLYQKMWEKTKLPSDRADDLPAGWERVILKCLEPVPGDRFVSIGEVLWALENPEIEEIPASVKPHRFTRRRLAVAAVSVPVLTAGVVFANLALKPLSAGMVLFPVANETGLKDYDYICEITDSELLRRLSGVPGLGTVAIYAPRSEATHKLDTRFILEGRLTAAVKGYQMVLTLTDNNNGQVFWTHEFDPFVRPASLDLQTEVTQRVIEEVDNYSTFGAKDTVSARVSPLVSPFRKWFGSTKLPGTTTMSSEAWDHYSRAHQLLDKDSENSILAGIDLLKKATDTDPSFALGFAALSRAYILLSGEAGHNSHRALEDAEGYALKSLSCDQQLPEPHVFLAAVKQNRWEWNDSIFNFNRALQLRPRYPQALRWFGGLRVQFANFDEGLRLSWRAIEMDPYGIPNYLCHGMYLFFDRQFDKALNVYNKQAPTVDASVLNNLAGTYGWLGHISTGKTSEHWFQLAENAIEQIEVQEQQEAMRNGSTPSADSAQLRAHVYSLAGDVARAQPYIARLERSLNAGTASPADVAKCYSVLGDQKTAVELLERAYVLQDPELMFIKVHPMFDAVRDNPQVKSIIHAMKLA